MAIYDLRNPNRMQAGDYIGGLLKLMQQKKQEQMEMDMHQNEVNSRILNTWAQADEATKVQMMNNPMVAEVIGKYEPTAMYKADQILGERVVNSLNGQAPRVPTSDSFNGMYMGMGAGAPATKPASPFDGVDATTASLLYARQNGNNNPNAQLTGDLINKENLSPLEYLHALNVGNKTALTADEAADNRFRDDEFAWEKPLKEGKYKSEIDENYSSVGANNALTGLRKEETETEKVKRTTGLPTRDGGGSNSLATSLAKSAVDLAEKRVTDAQAVLDRFEQDVLLLGKKQKDVDPNAIADRRITLLRQVNKAEQELESARQKYSSVGGAVAQPTAPAQPQEYDFDPATGKLIPRR